jgi:hypothetical protein
VTGHVLRKVQFWNHAIGINPSSSVLGIIKSVIPVIAGNHDDGISPVIVIHDKLRTLSAFMPDHDDGRVELTPVLLLRFRF